MTLGQFQQTSSIINRLKVVMITIAAFILFCIIALYLSSLSTLQQLQDLNSANNLLNLNSQIVEILNTLEKDLDAINIKTNVKELQFTYRENQKVNSRLIKESIRQAKMNSKLEKQLQETQNLLNQTDVQYKIVFMKLTNKSIEKKSKYMTELMADILVTKQLVMDAKEVLRESQISVKKESDVKFATIYKNRFKPLVVTISLSVLLFVFVITFGITISKKIGRSISNLLNATEHVAHGDFNYRVKILERDEIGRLTNAFNRMIESLKMAMDKIKRLQSITASFSEALTLEQVYGIIFKQAFEGLGAIAAGVVLVSDDKNYLELKRLEGYDSEIFVKWKKFSISADVPAAHVVRYKQPLYINAEEFKKYNNVHLKENIPAATTSIACLPLVISSEAFGALFFNFSSDKNFSEEEKNFMMALARQCAQAIYRSQLYDNAKAAIEARDEFLSIASHELKTPLTPLKLQVQKIVRMLSMGKADTITPERLKIVAASFDRQINRLSKLIDNLLDISRINTGKLTLEKSYFSLKEMINEVIKEYTQQLHDTNSVVDFIIDKDSVGKWDKVRIEQVFINLLTNAAKYAPGRPIHITITNKNNMAQIIVRDEGEGIAPEDQARIFNRFERGASSENIGGLGLGLYISKQIIQAHNGNIYVESSSVHGSVFVVELPKEIDFISESSQQHVK